MKSFLKTVASRFTKENVRWLVAVNVFGWVMQGAIFGALVLFGASELPAMISAKVANWIVFAAQCVAKARA